MLQYNLTIRLFFLIGLYFLEVNKTLSQIHSTAIDSLANTNNDFCNLAAIDIKGGCTFDLNSKASNFNFQLDSLRKLDLPAEEFSYKIDSAYKNFQDRTLSLHKKKLDSLGMDSDPYVSKLDSSITAKRQLIDTVLKTNGAFVLKDQLKMNELDLSLPVSPEKTNMNNDFNIGDISASTSGIEDNLNIINENPLAESAINIPEVNQLKEVQKSVGEVGEIKGNISTITSDKDQIKKAEAREEIQKTVENKVSSLKETKEINEAKSAGESLTGQFDQYKSVSPDSLKFTAKKEVIDYFAGKEEIVNKDLKSIFKLQKKYRNVADERFLPAIPPNSLKGTPFLERIIPGISFQAFRGKESSVDIAPFVGYKISGSLRSGMGVYRRIIYLNNNNGKLKGEDLFGLRVFADYKFFKEFFAHFELQRYKDNYTQTSNHVIENRREWNNRLNFGLFRTYKVNNFINGNFLIIYDLLKFREFPNTINSSIRFGFDYQIKKKKK